jgi:hypothetical protein
MTQRIPTASPENEPRAVLFARLPERLDDEQRRRKYDDPLYSKIREARIGAFLRGFSQSGDDGEVERVGIEVSLSVPQDGGFIAERLVELGAPLESVIEIESEKASITFTLAEVAENR